MLEGMVLATTMLEGIMSETAALPFATVSGLRAKSSPLQRFNILTFQRPSFSFLLPPCHCLKLQT
jgi:hypothetical protein